MRTIRPSEFAENAETYIRRAHNGDFVRVADTDGTCVVLISDVYYQMLNQALNLCIDHPEWMSNG